MDNTNNINNIYSYNVVPSRLVTLRLKRGLIQKDVYQYLSSLNLGPVSSGTVSQWETRFRPVPKYYIKPLAELFQCTEEYLIGVSDSPDSKEPVAAVLNKNINDKPNEITFADLFRYNKKPVYVEFLNKEKEDGWALYNDKQQTLVFTDTIIPLPENVETSMRFFSSLPEYMTYSPVAEKALSFESALSKEYVYIKMKTTNEAIHLIYDGIYRHNENHTAFINEKGLILPYAGINISYVVLQSKRSDELCSKKPRRQGFSNNIIANQMQEIENNKPETNTQSEAKAAINIPATAEVSQPVVKRRGRPAKSVNPVTEIINAPAPATTEVVQPVAKKRGRPQKAKTGNPILEAINAPVPTTTEVVQPVVKKRGRPAKVKTTSPVEAINAPAPATAEAAQPVVKKRGRPAKVKAVNPIAEAINAPISTAAEVVPPVAKKRGRPPKAK